MTELSEVKREKQRWYEQTLGKSDSSAKNKKCSELVSRVEDAYFYDTVAPHYVFYPDHICHIDGNGAIDHYANVRFERDYRDYYRFVTGGPHPAANFHQNWVKTSEYAPGDDFGSWNRVGWRDNLRYGIDGEQLSADCTREKMEKLRNISTFMNSDLKKSMAERYGLKGGRADKDLYGSSDYSGELYQDRINGGGWNKQLCENGGYVDYVGWKAEADTPEPCIPVGVVPFEATSREELKKYRLLKLQQSVIPADPRHTLL